MRIDLGEAAVVVAAAGVGLAVTPPAGPVQPMCVMFRGQEEHPQQAPHFRGGDRDQAAGCSPFLALALAAARVTSRKAWASRHSVICRCQPSHRRTSY